MIVGPPRSRGHPGRQPEPYARPLPGRALRYDATPVLLYQGPADGEPQPRPLSTTGPVELLEHVGQVLGRDSS